MTATPVHGPAVHVQGLEKSYKELQVLRGVDFDVARGSIFALLGSNGAGKTTVVKILATLAPGRRGVCRRQRLRCRHPGCAGPGVLQPHGPVRGRRRDPQWPGEPRPGRPPAAPQEPEAIAADLLDRFGLTDAAERRVSTYSGGMRRRLDIAMSLIGDPPVILLDEPTNGLDPQGRIEVWQAVKKLSEQGTTVLLTTQYLDEAEQLADRIAILHEGRIRVNGTLAELKKLLPPAKVEYVERQPTLEDVFLAIVGDWDQGGTDGADSATGR